MALEQTDKDLFDLAMQKIYLPSIVTLVATLCKTNPVLLLGFDQFYEMFQQKATEILRFENTWAETSNSKYLSKSITSQQIHVHNKIYSVVYLGLNVNGFQNSKSYALYKKIEGRVASYHEPVQKHFADFTADNTLKLIEPYFKINRTIKISFVILTGLNNARSLQKMLESFKAHTPSANKIEVIIVINGSKDNSLELPYTILDTDYNLKVINCPQNLGISGGFNEGIDAAQGSYVCLLQDDILFSTKNWHEELAYYLDMHPKIGVIGGFRAGYYFKKTVTNHFEAPYISIGSAVVGKPAWPYLKQHVVEADCANCMAVMFRKEMGRYDEHFLPNGIEDIVFCFEARRAGHDVYATDVGICHGLESATRSTKRFYSKLFGKKKPPASGFYQRLSRGYHYKLFLERYADLLREVPDDMSINSVNLDYIESKVKTLPRNWKQTN